MIHLKVHRDSSIDDNLEDHLRGFENVEDWIHQVKSLPYVKDAEWVRRDMGGSYTIIIFESEAHKNWFVLRWS
jgi:hypothetical protein